MSVIGDNSGGLKVRNRALVLSGIDKLSVEPWPPQSSNAGHDVPDGHVLCKVKSTGICGSDIHAWKEGIAAGGQYAEPFAIGHECAGEILAVGGNVTTWKKHDRVAILPAIPCNKCEDCTSGLTNLCPHVRYFGMPGCDGGAMTTKIVSQEQLARLPSWITWAEAGAIQPLAICIHMSRQAGNFMHKKVIIFGAGCIGVQLGRLAQIYAADLVVLVEKEKHRAQFAAGFLDSKVFVNPPRTSPAESTDEYSQRFARHILSSTAGIQRGFDIVVEASGAEECMNVGLRVARPNGTFVQVGIYGGPHPQLPVFEILRKQLTVRGTLRYTTNCFEQAIALVARRAIRLKDMISHVYHFDDALEAFEAVHKLEDKNGKKLLKVVILHDKEDVADFRRSSIADPMA